MVPCRAQWGHDLSMGRTLEKLGPALYSPECVEGEFCELHVNGVLGSSGYSLGRLFFLLTDHQHWAVGMPHNRVRDAAHQRSSHSAQSPAPHHDQARAYVLGNLYDLLGTIALG